MSDLTTLERLECGLSRVKKGWTQRVFARNHRGIAVPPYERDATCWCTVGALHFDQGDLIGEGARQIDLAKTELHKSKAEMLYYEYELLSVFNDIDIRTQEEIIHLYEWTIARIKKEQVDGRDQQSA